MAKIVYTWELGNDSGHIGGFMPLAMELRKRGHEVIFLVNDMSSAGRLIGSQGFVFMQIPHWLRQDRSSLPPGFPTSYSELLLLHGFGDPNILSNLVSAWRALFSLIGPAILIADHSPVSLFAGRALGLKRVSIGAGIYVPPRVSPMPNLGGWGKLPLSRFVEADERVVAVCNAVLDEIQSPAPHLSIVADLFEMDEHFLCTFRELDQYKNRSGARYWGSIFSVDKGTRHDWPDSPRNDRKNILAYLKPRFKNFHNAMQALKNSGHKVLAICPGISAQDISKYQTDQLRILETPLRLDHILPTCDLGVTHGGHGTVSALALNGIPMLFFPMHAEQFLTAVRVIEQGMGELMEDTAGDARIADALEHLLFQRKYKDKAIQFSSRYKDYSPDRQVSLMADRIDEILASKPPDAAGLPSEGG